MFSNILLAFLLLSSVSSLVVPRQGPPPGWATDYLEVCLFSYPLYTFLTFILALPAVP
jgi:hypothetical protein